jgi:hypothetical protein
MSFVVNYHFSKIDSIVCPMSVESRTPPNRIVQLTLNLPSSSGERIRSSALRAGLALGSYVIAAANCAAWSENFADTFVELEGTMMRLPTPGILSECPCHPSDNTHPEGLQSPETQLLAPKITYQSREELKAAASNCTAGQMTLQGYVDTCTQIEEWNYRHRLADLTLFQNDSTYRLMLPYAGIVIASMQG